MSNSLQKDTKVLLRRARYEEVWMMPEGSRSELGRLRVLDRGYAGSWIWTSENFSSKTLGE